MIWNLTKKVIISKRSVSALGFLERGRGMIGRKFEDFDAMIFNNCNAIHTMFMTDKIDVLFVDRENRICDLRKNLQPWLPLVRAVNASSVIELPENTIERTGTETGDFIDLNAELGEKAIASLKMGPIPAVTPETVVPYERKN